MRILIRSTRLTLHADDVDYITKRLWFALGRFADRVRTARVTLSDINSNKGGIDKRCIVEIEVDGRGRIVAGDVDTTIRSTADVTIARVSRAVARSVRRTLDRRHIGYAG